MIKIDIPYKRAVHMIIHSVINRDPKYWLDNTYVRWGKIEKDLWELEHLAQQPVDCNQCEGRVRLIREIQAALVRAGKDTVAGYSGRFVECIDEMAEEINRLKQPVEGE